MRNLKLLVPVFLLVASGTFSQTPTPKPIPGDDDVIKVDSRLIVIPVSVTDVNGQPVGGLTTQDFKVLEEGRGVTLEAVSGADKVPLEIALLFDVSATTNPMFQFQLETAAKFLKNVMRPEDRASIFLVGTKPQLILPRSAAGTAIDSIQKIEKTKGYTAFYDAVSMATDYLRQNAPEASRKVILAISDGEDTNSDRVAKAIQDGYKKINLNTIDSKSLYQLTVANRDAAAKNERLRVIRALQDADTVFYSINPGGASYLLNKLSVFGQENMQKFADDTGGSAFLPKFRQVETKDAYQNANNIRDNAALLDRIFAQLTAELRAQYLLQFYSEGEFPDNKYVKLAVSARPGTKVRARQGYYFKK